MDLSVLECLETHGVADDVAGDLFAENKSSIGLRDFLVANYACLHRRLMRHLGCPDLASDSLHDAWLRLGEIGVHESVQHPEAYVYRVAGDHC